MPCKIVKQHYSVNGASSGLSSVRQCENTSELLGCSLQLVLSSSSSEHGLFVWLVLVSHFRSFDFLYVFL